MNDKIKILDCTLRDGGYVNEWEFSDDAIKFIINSLISANIELIECGFVSQTNGVEINSSRFRSFEQINSILKEVVPAGCSSEFCIMINHGEYNMQDLPPYKAGSNSAISGIRLAFHKKDWKKALAESEVIIKKGYKLFVQPMVTLTYTDYEIIEMLAEFNKLGIFAMYIVDSFGSMLGSDFRRLYYLFEHNTDKSISIGYHSHNNLQLAYSNAIDFITIKDINRNIILDSSIHGMGRGAGNLNTELLSDYMNKRLFTNYNINPLLETIDNYLDAIFYNNYWGYSVAHFLSASADCHPNYASFLVNKKNLTIVDMRNILGEIESSKLVNFDRSYIDSIYINYKSRRVIPHNSDLNFLKNKTILILASGPNATSQKNLVDDFIERHNPYIIAVNHISDDYNVSTYFFSNSKRYKKFSSQLADKDVILTSNIIDVDQKSINKVVDYNSLITSNSNSTDNVTILLINLLINLGLQEVYIAGFDGYKSDSENYSYIENDRILERNAMDLANKSVMNALFKLTKKIKIEFITKSIYNTKAN